MEAGVVSGLGEIFPWLFRREVYIFEALDKLHVVLRVPNDQPIVIREADFTFNNTRTFLTSVMNASGSIIEFLELCALESDIRRVSRRGGCVVFRSIQDLPKEIDDIEIVSLSEALDL